MVAWLKDETPTKNWALLAFLVLTINGVIDLAIRVATWVAT